MFMCIDIFFFLISVMLTIVLNLHSLNFPCCFLLLFYFLSQENFHSISTQNDSILNLEFQS